MDNIQHLEKLAKLIRYWILKMTTEAGSGHATSSLSAVELMTALMFGNVFRFSFDVSRFGSNDRLIFSKGHASPLFYAVWAAADLPQINSEKISGRSNTPPSAELRSPLERGFSADELMTLRKFGSRLEGHPTMRFPFTEAATGSLGQGLSVGMGMALSFKLQVASFKLQTREPKVFVLLGDSEMAEGQVWEAVQLAAHYKLDNLIGIIDVNRLGQRGETMAGWNVGSYKRKLKAFGWQTFTVDGHSLEEILGVYKQAMKVQGKPVMIIAKTVKGKGVSFLENKNGWHGKALKPEELERALKELGEVDNAVRGIIQAPQIQNAKFKMQNENSKLKNNNWKLETAELRNYQPGEMVATRQAYGEALVKLGSENPEVVVLDGEVSNSTMSEKFKEKFPKRFFEMFIAEQNMVGTAVGLARCGKIPWVSTFSAFFTRAFDQIRMAAYSEANIKFCGSHAGVSIGEDGVSQMGLEDIALFRSIKDSVVLYPSDAVSTVRLLEEATMHKGLVYLRTTRGKTPVLYGFEEEFPISGSKVLRQSEEDRVTVVAAGITVHESLKAYEELLKEGVKVRVIDLYSIKPLDVETVKKAAAETKALIVVEDHYPEGGIGEAVMGALTAERQKGQKASLRQDYGRQAERQVNIVSLAVRKMPMSGTPEELLRYEEIDAEAIVKHIKKVLI